MIVLLNQNSLAQDSKNTGTLKTYSTGSINIKNSVMKSDGTIINENGNINVQNGALNSSGTIINQGKIEVEDSQMTVNQSNIDGTVEFKSDKTAQAIPQISYDKLNILGASRKEIQVDNQNIEVRGKLFTSSDARLIWDPTFNVEIDIKNEIEHNGTINPAFNHGFVNLNGVNPQDIYGAGRYTSMMLDNDAGADITNGGGFRISTKLVLNKGILRNSINNNFILEDNTQIERHVGSSLAETPQFEGKINVRYEGNGQITSGKEIPVNINSLQDLEVYNSDGLQLSTDIVANKSIVLNSNITTYTTDNNDDIVDNYELRLRGDNDPTFNSDNLEIKGRFTRSDLNWNSQKVVFNNPYTYAIVNASDVTTMNALTMDVKGKRIYKDPSQNGSEKVQRTVEISAKDINGDQVSNQKAKVAYAWKHDIANQNTDQNETSSNLINNINDLKLQRWNTNGVAWETNESSQTPILVTSTNGQNWYISVADIDALGEFTVGLPDLNRLYFAARVIMEGAWRQEKESMDYELRQRDLIPTTPPDTYPYNLDPNRLALYGPGKVIVPDSVVDWVLIEFRDDAIAPTKKYYRTCFLKYDGNLVDINGTTKIDLTEEYAQNIQDDNTKSFYVAIHHRNHLAVMTQDAILISKSNNDIVDLTNVSNAWGGTLKPIGFKNGNVVFGMYGGNLPNSDIKLIDEVDYSSAWDKIGKVGYLDEDFYLNGIVTTTDYNVSWNNREETSPIK